MKSKWQHIFPGLGDPRRALVEEVARAIVLHNGGDPDSLSYVAYTSGEPISMWHHEIALAETMIRYFKPGLLDDGASFAVRLDEMA